MAASDRVLPLRRRAAAVLALPLALASVAHAPAAHAATEVTTTTVETLIAEGSVGTFDGCRSTGMRLVAGEDFISYTFSFDDCTGAFGSTFGEAVPEVFEVRPGLATVHVVADIPLRDAQGRLTGEILRVDDTWTAQSRPTRTRTSTSEVRPDGSRSSTRTVRSQVQSVVTGTLPFALHASVTDTRTTTVVVTRT